MIVYIYTFPNGKKYIGQTVQTLAARASNGEGYRFQPLIYNAIQKYGWENIQKEIIECSSEEEMDELEQELIAKYKTQDREFGYNLESGGHKEKHHSEETKKKISKALTGRVFTEEHKKKISEAQIGKKISEEQKKILSELNKGENNPNYGKPRSEEVKRKISQTKSKTIMCIETQEIFNSAQLAASKYNCSPISIRSAANGNRETAVGYHWKYIE